VASGAIGKPDKLLFITSRPCPVAIQTPAHILPWYVLRDCHAADFAVASLAIHTRRDMGAVIKVYKIRLNENRHPGDGFTPLNIPDQGLLCWFGVSHLLVTAPAF